MRPLRSLVPALVLALAAAGCDDSTGPVEPQELSGFWLGLTDASAGPGTQARDTVELLLTEDVDGGVTGTAVLRSAGSARVFTVRGANDFPTVFLVLSTDDDGADDLISLRAEFTGTDVLRARLDGGGFSDERADFFRRELVL